MDRIISKIENFAPPTLAKEWDNSGWQVYLGNNSVNKIMLAISPTLDVVENAVKAGCSLLITHHPLVFSGIKSFTINNYANLPLIRAVQNNLQVYSAHTNLDITEGGVADVLARQLDLTNISPISLEEKGFGRKGEFEQPENIINIANKIKNTLNTNKLKLINPDNVQKVKHVAVLPGSGGSFIPKLKGIDLYITGDIKYHDALLVKDFAVIDAGHFNTEKIILPVLKELLSEFDIKIFIADEKVPWEVI